MEPDLANLRNELATLQDEKAALNEADEKLKAELDHGRSSELSVLNEKNIRIEAELGGTTPAPKHEAWASSE